MDSSLSSLLSVNLVLFALFVFGVVFALRKISEKIFPILLENKVWLEAVLPIAPMVVGALIGLAAGEFPFPGDLKTLSGRIIFGAVAGMLSGKVYRVANALLKSKDEEEPENGN